MSPVSDPELQSVVDRLAPTLRSHAAQAEAERTLAPEAHAAMVEAGLFRLFVPRALGGIETPLVQGFEVVEDVARIDSAAGWTLQIAACPVGIGALFPDAVAREVYGDPHAVVAGGFSPPGTVEPEAGGFRLNGRWGWASGCALATWIISPAVELRDGAPVPGPDGQPAARVCLYPASDAQIDDTWQSLGMRGTGSHDVVADNVFVPEDHAAPFRPFHIDPGPAFGGPLYKLGLMPTVLGNAVVALGIARAAIDESLDIVRAKVPAHFQTPPGQRASVHAHLGRAEATLSAARAYFYATLESAWAAAQTGAPVVGTEERKHLQLAASFAAEASATAVDHVHAALGGHGVLESQYPFARHFRDVHTITQHALCSATRYESMGQIMLGMETDWALFHL